MKKFVLLVATVALTTTLSDRALADAYSSAFSAGGHAESNSLSLGNANARSHASAFNGGRAIATSIGYGNPWGFGDASADAIAVGGIARSVAISGPSIPVCRPVVCRPAVCRPVCVQPVRCYPVRRRCR